METITVVSAPFTQTFHPRDFLPPDRWAKYVSDLEADGCIVSGNQVSYTVTFPSKEVAYSPTLADVHKRLFDDWGFFSLSWQDGLLCPFDDNVVNKNITCSNGRRKRCHSLLISHKFVSHLSKSQQSKLIGRVQCYEWSHVLSNAYWDIPIDELMTLPDDIDFVTFYIMRRVIKNTNWHDWKQELKKRATKRRGLWLAQLPPRKRKPI